MHLSSEGITGRQFAIEDCLVFICYGSYVINCSIPLIVPLAKITLYSFVLH